MTALGADDAALVAAEVAALRRSGWPAGRAVALVADRLPPGPVRQRLSEVASALEQGQRGPQADPLLAVLALGDRAGPGALEEASRASLAELEARDAFRATLAPLLGLAAFCGLLMAGGGWVTQTFGWPWSLGSMPAPTEAALALLRAARFVGPALALAAFALLFWLPSRWAPGAGEQLAAASLRRFASLLDAGASDAEAASWAGAASASMAALPGVMRQVARFTEWLSSFEGRAAASKRVARELEEEGRRRVRLWAALLLAGGVALFVLVVVPIFTFAFVLPIFSIAGAIK